MASGLNQSSDSDLMWGLRNAVESCNDVTKEDLYSDKFVDLLVNDSHVGHVRPDFARALLEHGSLNDDDGYVLFSRSGSYVREEPPLVISEYELEWQEVMGDQ